MEEMASKEVTSAESEQLRTLLKDLEIRALVAKHKPQHIEVDFNFLWLNAGSLAASFPRIQTAGPYVITLSPLLLKYGLSDQIAFPTIILHELGHVADRVNNWRQYHSTNHVDREQAEYKADDFVIECGWKDNLIATLRRSIDLYIEHNVPAPMTNKRLSRLLSTD